MKNGDTFWYHECPHNGTNRYIRIGEKCATCEWEQKSQNEKAKIRQHEYRERMEQDYDN